MPKCPQCRGKGQITCTVIEAGGKSSSFETACLTCRGEKTVTVEQQRMYRAMQNAWCKCGKDYGSDYHPDNAGMKHHYTCQKCGKITQVG